MCCSDRNTKVKFSLYTPVQLQLHAFLTSAIHSNKCSPSHPGHSIQSEYPRYLRQCDAEQRTDLINWWFVIVIIDLFCLSVALQVIVIRIWHIRNSLHNILLQFPQHTALEASNPSANHILLDTLTSYILCNFLPHDISCVVLPSVTYKHPYVTPPTRSIPLQMITLKSCTSFIVNQLQ